MTVKLFCYALWAIGALALIRLCFTNALVAAITLAALAVLAFIRLFWQIWRTECAGMPETTNAPLPPKGSVAEAEAFTDALDRMNPEEFIDTGGYNDSPEYIREGK
jgi:hypothetical protein